MLIINLNEIARFTQARPQQPPPSVGDVMDNTDSRPHDSRDCEPVSSDYGPEVSVLPILTCYINLEQLAECV